MWLWTLIATMILVMAATLIIHRLKRRQVLSNLAANRHLTINQFSPHVATTADQTLLHLQFDRENIVTVGDFLQSNNLSVLRTEAETNIPEMVVSYIPTHKKGRTLSYEKIHRLAPGCLSFYHSREIQQFVSNVVGMPVYPTPDGDQSSLSVLCYKDAGDHINWHYDHNFYRGRHFTVLLSLANESQAGGASQSTLYRKSVTGEEQRFETPPNTLVIFEGAKVLHKASPTIEGDLRLMLSMTYCADPRTNWITEFARRVKDTAFYGIRALWD